MKPRKHAEVIKQWADGAEIEWFYCGKWIITNPPFWLEERKYRVKPQEVIKSIVDVQFEISELRKSIERINADVESLFDQLVEKGLL